MDYIACAFEMTDDLNIQIANKLPLRTITNESQINEQGWQEFHAGSVLKSGPRSPAGLGPVSKWDPRSQSKAVSVS